MKYKGIELKEITEPQIFNPPKEMLVWNEGYDEPVIRKVWSIAPPLAKKYFPVFTTFNSTFEHCSEIPEEQKPRRATNRELSRWLARGNGQVLYGNYMNTAWNYTQDKEENPASEYTKVRKWDDTDWHEPDVKYMGIE